MRDLRVVDLSHGRGPRIQITIDQDGADYLADVLETHESHDQGARELIDALRSDEEEQNDE